MEVPVRTQVRVAMSSPLVSPRAATMVRVFSGYGLNSLCGMEVPVKTQAQGQHSDRHRQ